MSETAKTLSQIARLVGGEVVGDGNVEIERFRSIEDAGPGDITFLIHSRYRSYLNTSKASAIVVGPDLPLPKSLRSGIGYLKVSQPYVAFARILTIFSPPPRYVAQISEHSTIDSSARLSEGVTVFPHVYVGRRVTVGRGSVLFPGVFLGDDVEVGEQCVLHPQVTIREGCHVGNRVILHPGVVVGSDGFGYAGEGSQRIKIPQIGIVEIEDDVEIGANTAVDRATLGRTIIGRGTKLDNLVHIAHNVVVGEYSLIVAQAGIAGSVRIGKDVTIAGQVGVVNHVEIGDRATIGPQSGIPHSVPPGAILSGGIAAAPHREWLKVMALLPRLPKLWNAVRSLELKVAALTGKAAKGGKAHVRR